ncbi:MAG TPA: DUF748 domain-containing protein [Anaeromyxobacteraceae bacterium]|nr:DUF748 domain-containing protein [Anaeromyxobacteraceae bacterium]
MRALAAFLRRHRRLLWVAAAAVATYGLLGFLVAPGIVRRQLEERLGSALHRVVRVSKVRVNPFALSVTVEGFEAKDHDGSTLFSFERLQVNANALPLLRKELDFSAVSLEGPFALISLDAKGRLSFHDLFETGGEGATPDEGGGLSIRVERLRISGARVAFRDRSRHTPFETTLGPVSLELENFRTHRKDNQSPYAFSGQTESGERFGWNGTFLLDPIRSKGTIVLENVLLPKYAPYYQDETRAQVRSGVLGLRASYELEWAPAKRVLRLAEGALSVRRLELARPGEPPLLDIAELDVAGVSADAFERQGEVAQVALRGGDLLLRREKDGQTNLAGLLGAPAEAIPPPEPAPARPPAGASPSGFRYRVGQIAVENVRIAVSDLAAPRPVELAVEVERCQLDGLSSDPAVPARLKLAALLNGRGRLSASGDLYPLAPRGEMELTAEAVDLAPFGAYLGTALDLELEGGVLFAKVLASFDGPGPAPTWTVRGEGRVDGLRLKDGRRREDFLSWKSLRLEGVEAAPGRWAARSLRLVEPGLRLAVWEDGERNLAVVLRRHGPGAPGADAGSTGKGAAPKAPAEAGQRFSLRSLRVERGRVSFLDRSVRPPALLEARELEVRVHGLSSDPRSRAEVEASTTLGGAPLSVRGRLQPLLVGDSTDLAIQSKAIDLTPLGPYVAKFVGYTLEKGKLDLDLRYTVKARELRAQNLARVDQFTLGEKTDSPEATSLPVKLGLAVLTDPDGVIRLDVPAAGSIDAPDFSLGRMVWHAVVNFFTKVALSPFSVLGNLVGGGTANLDVVDFAAAQASLDPSAEQKLEVLAKGLQARPALRLDVEGSSDEAADGAALGRAALEAEVRQAKWKSLRRKDPSLELAAVVVQPEEYPRWLEAAYQALPPDRPAKGDAQAKPGAEEMEARLIAAAPVRPEAYRELASRRAEAVRARLLQSGGIDASRIFLVAGGERAAKEKGARAYFTLR